MLPGAMSENMPHKPHIGQGIQQSGDPADGDLGPGQILTAGMESFGLCFFPAKGTDSAT